MATTIETSANVRLTLHHEHVLQYLRETDPLDRIVILRKTMEMFEAREIDDLEGYIREMLGQPSSKKARTLAVCQWTRDLHSMAK